jgi:hypothetical protein
MAVNIKAYTWPCLLVVFSVGCVSDSRNTTAGTGGVSGANSFGGFGGSLAGAGAAGTGIAGTGIAGTGIAGTGIAGAGIAGTGIAGTGIAGTGIAGTGAAGTPSVTDAGPLDSGGQPPTDAAAPADSSTADSNVPATGRFPPVADVYADGPYVPMTVNNTGPANAYTLFHPQELAPNGALNPILSWGNGMMTNPAMYPNLLPHLASHGFVIIAANTSSVTGADIRAGIDWLIEQNQDPASPLYQKLDPNNVAAFGYSMGSLGTFEIADDPRLTTTVHISGGAQGSANVRKLHKPAAFFCDELTTAPNCQPDFDIAPVPVFYGVFKGADHVGTMLDPHISRVAGATTAWLRWFLMGDETQKAQFVGASCGLCTDPNWVVQQKDLI